jgi:hypothetical protein
MEEAADLANYPPLSFKIPKEQEYIAFLAYHLLTMSFVYLNIWRKKRDRLLCYGPYGADREQE